MLGLTGWSTVYVCTTIISVYTTNLLTSVYINQSLPGWYSVFTSILVSCSLGFLIPYLLCFPLDFLLDLQYINFRDYFYAICHICTFCYSPLLIQGTNLQARSNEVNEILRGKRCEAKIIDYNCYKAFDRYKKAIFDEDRLNKLKELFRLVGQMRDMSRDIDSIAQNKSSSNAFKSKSYSKFVAEVIKSLPKR